MWLSVAHLLTGGKGINKDLVGNTKNDVNDALDENENENENGNGEAGIEPAIADHDRVENNFENTLGIHDITPPDFERILNESDDDVAENGNLTCGEINENDGEHTTVEHDVLEQEEPLQGASGYDKTDAVGSPSRIPELNPRTTPSPSQSLKEPTPAQLRELKRLMDKNKPGKGQKSLDELPKKRPSKLRK